MKLARHCILVIAVLVTLLGNLAATDKDKSVPNEVAKLAKRYSWKVTWGYRDVDGCLRIDSDPLESDAVIPTIWPIRLAEQPVSDIKQLTCPVGLVLQHTETSVLSRIASLSNVSSLSIRLSRIEPKDAEEFGAKSKIPVLRISFDGDVEGTLSLLDSLSSNESIRSLELWNAKLSDREFVAIGKLHNLETLALGGCEFSDAHLASQLTQLKRLKRLYVSRHSFSSKGLETIAASGDLEGLALVYCRFPKDDVKMLALLKNLRRINLDHSKVTDDSFCSICKLSVLESISVNSVDLTDDAFKNCENHATLKVLGAGGTKLTDAGARYLRAKGLEWVDVSMTQIGDPFVEAVVPGSKIGHFLAAGTRISDASARHFLNSSVNVLSVEGTRITLAGIGEVSLAPNLTVLFLSKRMVDQQTISRIGKQRPGLLIKFGD